MNKIFQKRVNNSDLLDSRSTLFSPKYLETWNKDGIKIVYGALKRITGSEKIKVFFNGDMTFTLIANKAYTGSLEYGDMDEMPKIRLTDGNTTNSYEVLNSNGETFINLDSETTKKDGKEVSRIFYKNIAYFIARIDNVAYRISIYSPKTNKTSFTLPYEDELKETLFSFNSSTSIDDIVKTLEYYLGKLDKFSKIEISRSISEKRKTSKTTDELVLKSGELDRFTQSKKVGSKNYKVTISDNKISYAIENLDLDEAIEPDKDLITMGKIYMKKYPKK